MRPMNISPAGHQSQAMWRCPLVTAANIGGPDRNENSFLQMTVSWGESEKQYKDGAYQLLHLGRS